MTLAQGPCAGCGAVPGPSECLQVPIRCQGWPQGLGSAGLCPGVCGDPPGTAWPCACHVMGSGTRAAWALALLVALNGLGVDTLALGLHEASAGLWHVLPPSSSLPHTLPTASSQGALRGWAGAHGQVSAYGQVGAWLGVGRCGQAWGDVGRCSRREQAWAGVAGVGKCGEAWGGVGRCSRHEQAWAGVAGVGRCRQVWAGVAGMGRCGQV